MNKFTTIIIGGGVAGLTCAKYLHDSGMSFLLLEADDEIGGRVRTDFMDGFRLDRGFQVFLTNYPEARKILNFDALDLKLFTSGAMIWQGKKSMTIQDPFQDKSAFLSMLFSSIGSWKDKMKIRQLIKEVSEKNDESIFNQDASDTLSFLQQYGWSDKMINNFFKPFFGGVFLENELTTSSNLFQFLFKQFFKGSASLPALGIQEIPKQIAAMLPADSIRTNTKVASIANKQVLLENGEVLFAENIVIATDARNADKLLGINQQRQYNTTTCTYFSAEYSPMKKGNTFLSLNTDRRSPIHNFCVPSDISSDYAPAGKSLISVSTHGSEKFDEKLLPSRIKRDANLWFGSQVNVWKHLKTYHFPEALVQFPANYEKQSLKLAQNLYRCGDYLAYPSLNAAMQTGREVAESIALIWED